MEKAQSTAGVYVERTLALIKPDGIDKAGEIEEIILRSGFTIIQVGRLFCSGQNSASCFRVSSTVELPVLTLCSDVSFLTVGLLSEKNKPGCNLPG